MLEFLKTESTILIVDDTPESIWLLAETLKEHYRISAARSGAKMFALLQRNPLPDLILLDVQMPEMDGYEVCKRLKADSRLASIPVVFITANINPEDESKGLRLGGIDFIHKPFSPDILRARIKNIFTAKMQSDELHRMVQARTESLHKMQQGTILMLADIAEWRDPETGSHIKRTQEYVHCIAQYLATSSCYSAYLPQQIIELMRLCAPLHDVGKVGIPDGILLKQGKLSPGEFAIMQQHTLFGANILEKAIEYAGDNNFWDMAYQVARWHHERWDGSGYPDGLKGHNIPLSARIMAVADVYDALVSRRPYKEPLAHEEAIDILQCGSGSHFDSVVIDAVLQLEDEIFTISKQYQDSSELAGILG